VIGVPISAAAYYFLQLVGFLQAWVFKDLPQTLGFGATPLWWPLPILGIAGVVVSLTIRKLPGNGGHSPVNGFHGGCRTRARRVARHFAGRRSEPGPGSGPRARGAADRPGRRPRGVRGTAGPP